MRHVPAILTLILLPWLAVAQSSDDVRRDLRLREIVVEDGGVLPRSELRGLVDLQEGEIYPATALAAAEDSARARVQRLDGYPFARLTGFAVDTLAGGRSVRLQIAVDPGPQPRIAELTLSGPGAAHAGDLRPLLASDEGEPFFSARWREDLTRMVDYFRDRGYPFATARTETLEPVFHGDTVAVRIEAYLVPGARVTVQRVEFAGLDRTRPQTARRVARLTAGPYRPAAVDRARRRLLRTEWFADVAPAQVFRDRDGDYGVLYTVREQPGSSVTGALGYSPDDPGLAGELDATLANLFGGGRAFDLHWRRDSDDSRAFRVAYLEPFVFGSMTDLRLHLDQEVRDSLYVAVELGIAAEARLGDSWTLTGSLRRKNVTADSLAPGDIASDYLLHGAGLALGYDSRDRPRNPRRGASATAGSERLFVNATDSGEPGDTQADDSPADDLYRSSFDADAALPLRGPWVVYGALHGVDVRADNGGRPPFAEWAQLGGASTVRGYTERSLLAPRAGWGTLELRYLLGPLSRAFVLADLAALDDPTSVRWEGSYGAGVQVDTGIGLLGVAVAVPAGDGFSAAVVHARAEARF